MKVRAEDLRIELETTRAEHTCTVEDLRDDRDRVRAGLDTARTEHDRATKELRAEHAAALKSARDLMVDRVAAADAAAAALRGQVEDLRGVVNELRTARDRGSRKQRPGVEGRDAAK